jgi:chemotaxis protein methyltransferase CheR
VTPGEASLGWLDPPPGTGTGPTLTPHAFHRLRRLARDCAGMDIPEGKESLVAARVARRLRALGLSACDEYVRLLEHDDGNELVAFLDVMSTNVTAFFREPSHFEVVAETLLRWSKAGQRSFHLWSAATSSGQEAYSLAMTCQSTLGSAANYAILATDLSKTVLRQARAARYNGANLEGVSARQRERYFRRDEGEPGWFRVRDEIANHVVFARLNLARRPYPMRGPFDCVFCRNVLMYLAPAVRRGVISEIERLLKPGGLLVTGHAETLLDMRSRFRVVRPSVFVKEAAAA